MMRKIALITSIAATALFMAACPKRVSIGEIEANPSRYNDKTVAVAGVVKNSFGLSIPVIDRGGGIYKIDDGTGSIWVITKEGVPGRDAQIGVKGKVRSGVVYNGRNYGLAIMEDDRRYRKN